MGSYCEEFGSMDEDGSGTVSVRRVFVHGAAKYWCAENEGLQTRRTSASFKQCSRWAVYAGRTVLLLRIDGSSLSSGQHVLRAGLSSRCGQKSDMGSVHAASEQHAKRALVHTRSTSLPVSTRHSMTKLLVSDTVGVAKVRSMSYGSKAKTAKALPDSTTVFQFW